jgi:hypothetical protein
MRTESIKLLQELHLVPVHHIQNGRVLDVVPGVVVAVSQAEFVPEILKIDFNDYIRKVGFRGPTLYPG